MKKRLNVMNLLKKYTKLIFIFLVALIFINAFSQAEIIEGGIRKEILQTPKREIKMPEQKPKYSTGAILAYNKGVEYFNLAEYDKSIASFKSAIKQENRFSDAYFNLGILYEYFGNIDGAIISFNRAYVINKKDYEALYYVIKCYAVKGDSTAVKFYFSKMPKDSEFYQNAQELLK